MRYRLTAGLMAAAVITLTACASSRSTRPGAAATSGVASSPPVTVAVGSGHASASPPRAGVSALPTSDRAPLSSCVAADPPVRPPVSGAARTVVTGDRFTSSLVLDGGTFRVDPPASSAAPAITADLARCNLMAGYENDGPDVFGQSAPQGDGFGGMTFGLGEVTLPDSLLTGHSTTEGVSGTGLPKPGPLSAYHHRLAWVAVTHPSIAASCPAMTTAPTASATSRPVDVDAYQVLAIDAETGGAGILYTAPAPPLCGGAGLTPAYLDAATQRLSVPWTAAGHNAAGQLTIVSVPVTACDGVSGAAVDSKSGVLTVQVDHPLSDCGPAIGHLEPVSIGTSGQPAVVRHGPVGALDVASS